MSLTSLPFGRPTMVLGYREFSDLAVVFFMPTAKEMGMIKAMSGASITEADVLYVAKSVLGTTTLRLQRINTGCFSVNEGGVKRWVRTAGAGTLDFEGYDKHGRFVGVECKRPVGGRLSEAQTRRINDIIRCGGGALVVHGGENALTLLQEAGCL